MFKKLFLIPLIFLFSGGFTPTKQTVLFSGGCPTIGGACPSIEANFQTNKYWVKGIGYVPLTSIVSTTRASSKTNLLPTSVSGFTYSIFSSNVLAIDNNGALIEEARTNQLFNSTVPATQTTGSLATGVYTLWVNGSGSAQMSLGTGVGCGTGTATQGTPVNFTISTAGTCTVTVTGALNAFQLELGSFGTSLIVTAGGSATRAADVPQLIGPALMAALAAKSAFFQTNLIAGGTGPRMLDFNGIRSILFASSTQVQISNSVNSVSATIGGAGIYSGTVKTAAGFNSTSMTIKANDGTQGVSVNSWGTPSGTVYLGNRSAGDRALNGYMQRFALSPIKGVFDNATRP